MCGFTCRYNAETISDSRIRALKGLAVPVCPEVLGGLGIPRLPSEIRGGTGLEVLLGSARVVNSAGEDVTAAFLDGARKALLIGLEMGCSAAVLKARSPSFGTGVVYDGTFSHTRRTGDGVLAALLRKHGLEVLTDEELAAARNQSAARA